MSKRDISKQWRRALADPRLPSAQIGRPLVSPQDRAVEVLPLMSGLLFRPELVALIAEAAGLNLNGDEVLRLARTYAETYASAVFGMCCPVGDFVLPSTLLAKNGYDARARIVAELDALLAQERSGK